MSVLVVQHLVTLAEATRIMRLFKQKKHAGMGYFFELQDLGGQMHDAVRLSGLEPYSDAPSTRSPMAKWWREDAYVLRVYRDVPSR